MASAKAGRNIANMARDYLGDINDNYLNRINIVTDTTEITSFAKPIISDFNLKNDFINVLIDRIVKTQVMSKLMYNPLSQLDGDDIPLGRVEQDIFINPTHGRNFEGDDYIDILKRHEADVKVQYIPLNVDRQYRITISEPQLRTAFTSWEELAKLVESLTTSLYNGMYIERYNFTKGIVGTAYTNNTGIIDTTPVPTDEASATAFAKKLRNYYLNFKVPSIKYNSWLKNGGYGFAVHTFTDPEDIIILIRNDIATEVDFEVLAMAYNLDKVDLMGKIIYVDDFSTRDTYGNVIATNDNILAFIGDRRWFRINTQFSYLDEPFRNPGNRTTQWYLNDKRGYNFSLFANGVIIATEAPNIPATSISVVTTDLNITKGTDKDVTFNIEPINTTDALTVTGITSGGTDVSANVSAVLKNKNTIMLNAKQALTQSTFDVAVKVGTKTTTVTLTVV